MAASNEKPPKMQQEKQQKVAPFPMGERSASTTSVSTGALADGQGNRIVRILEARSNPEGRQGFSDNRVITSHYTVANFLPKNLGEQFTMPANVYFLFLSILQVIPGITTTGQYPTILFPLLCVITLTAIKDAVADSRRHKSDKAENDRCTLCVRDKLSRAAETKWCEVQVGDVVILKNSTYVPADMVLLASSHEEGHAYVETANLDGETNLKTKQVPDPVFQLMGGKQLRYDEAVQSVQNISGIVECEEPNEFLYSFMGTLYVRGGNGNASRDKVPLDENSVVLRGCKIKNVDWAMGVAVYTGKQSKIMMNGKERKARKLSHLEKDLGSFTACIFLIQCVLCLIAALTGTMTEFHEPSRENRSYLPRASESCLLLFILRFFNFIILFSNYIPISLLVSVSLVKLTQSFFLYSDPDMVHEGIHCMPRTSDLNEEMGQVDYVFSDKTGTLTCNKMDFRKICVEGVCYGEGMTEIKRNVLLKMGGKVDEPPRRRPPCLPTTPHVDLVDDRLEELLHNRTGPHFLAVRSFLMHLAINHEVVPELGDDGSLSYSASSPDEAALCYGARHFGFMFCKRDSKGIQVELEDGSVMQVRIHAILKFNAMRKRSSVVARFQEIEPSGTTRSRLAIFTKGADSVIVARLAPRLQNAQQTLKSLAVLKEFAEDGLRTLCFAGRELSQEEFDRWLVKYKEASCTCRDRQERLDQVADEIETNLELHGVTGIEDRLQDDVASTIIKMTNAGIRVWMLTGDKTETAINIGIATGLLPVEAKGEQPVFMSSDFEVDRVFLPQDMSWKLHIVAETAREARSQGRMYEGLIIDGRCLEVALEPGNDLDFVAISRICKTVICCRVSPKQKGAVVRLIKREEKAITLAIGDGANDCNMIQSADVGIGIRGLEGLQAFNVCDYGISQFRFLQYLLLVHGRWCYRRIAILVNYTFYKNIVVVLPQYFLGCVSGFSGQKLYNDILYQSYNVVHSMMPIMLFGILDQDVCKRVSLQHPELYMAGPRREYMNVRLAAMWILSGVWHSIIIFFVPYYTMTNGNTSHPDGKANDIWQLGTVVYFLVTVVVNLRALLETFYITKITAFGLFFSFFFWVMQQGYLSGFLTGTIVSCDLYGSTQRLLGSPMVYLVVLTSVCLALGVDMQCKGIRCSLYPSTLHKVQEQVLQERYSRGLT